MLKKSIVSTTASLMILSASFAQNSAPNKKINTNAPVVCSKSILIDASPEVIWQILTDINQWPAWQSDVSKSKLNGLLEINSTFDWKSGGAKIHSTLHTVEPFSQLGWTGKTMGIKAIHNWSITEKNGQIRVFVEESMEGFLAGIFKKSFNRSLEKGMDTWLVLLKETSENSKSDQISTVK